MWGTIALSLAIPVAAIMVTTNLRNITVVPQIRYGSGLKKIRDMTRSLGKVRTKAVRFADYSFLNGTKDTVSDIIQEVTKFLVFNPRGNIMSQLFSTNIERGPLVVQSKVVVNIFRPSRITGFTLVNQSGYLFLLALGS